MGCDIHYICEVKENGRWHKNTSRVFPNPYYEEPTKKEIVNPETRLDYKKDLMLLEPANTGHYAWFDFLAQVRSSGAITAIDAPRGAPDDASEDWITYREEWGTNMHSISYIKLDDFEENIWDTVIKWHDGESTYRETFKEEIELIIVPMQQLWEKYDDVRIIFGFDN